MNTSTASRCEIVEFPGNTHKEWFYPFRLLETRKVALQ